MALIHKKSRLALGALVTTAAALAPTEAPLFVNVLSGSGIDYRNVSGEPEKRYILSSLGSGTGLLEYDEDGDLRTPSRTR